MGSRLLEQAKSVCETTLLPIAVCLIAPDRDGEILCANDEFKRVFGEDAVGRHAVEFYENREDRDRFVERLEKDEDLRQEILRLKIDEKSLVFKDFTRSLREEDGKRVGHLSCLIEYSEEDHSLKLVHDLPVGTFGLNRNDCLTFGNRRLAALFDREKSKLKGTCAKNVVMDQKEAIALRRKIDEQGGVVDERIDLLRGNETFKGSITAARTPKDLNLPYAGCEGTVMDVTKEEEYRRLIDEMPIGLYELEREQSSEMTPREILKYCNPAFARMNGYEKPEQIIGRPIEDFHRSRETYQAAVAAFKQQDEAGIEAPVELPIKKQQGKGFKERWVAVSARLLRDRSGEVVGRLGVSRDVTDERDTRQWNELLTQDIGNLVHSYSSSMMSLRHTLDLALEFSGESPFGEWVRAGALEEPLEKFEEPRWELAEALSDLLDKRHEDHAKGAWENEDWETLEQSKWLLDTRVRDMPEEHRYATLRQIAAEVLGLLFRMQSGYLPKKLERRARSAASEIRRLGTVLALMLAKAKLIELGTELRTVKDTVTRHDRAEGPLEILRAEELVRMSLAEQAEYAQSREVTFRRQLDPDAVDARLEGRERDLVRALGNIIHNAVKYSWHTDSGTYATIRMFTYGDKVIIEVTNYGVPIPEDELRLVFKIGFRGRFSGDRRRAGSGIGLWDARRVARSHAGKLSIESKPASGYDVENYEQPFLTTVKMELPRLA